jgi:hypothetical protein
VGGWEKFPKQEKKKAGGGLGENKVPKKKPTEVRGKKKLGRGRGENKVAKKT